MAATRSSPLRRWERFFPAFAAIDDAIEGATGHPRGEFRSVRARIATLLRAAAARDDDGNSVVEELCAALDAAMEEALATLRVAAASAGPPESTALAESVVALSEHHESARVRALAGDVVRRWTAAAEAALAGAVRFLEVVNKHTTKEPPRILRGSAVVVAGRARDARAAAADQDKERYVLPAKTTKMPIERANGSVAVKKFAAPLVNKQPNGKMEAEKAEAQAPAAGGGNRVQSEEEMMASTKRKLREGYRQVEAAKRQRKLQFVEAPKKMSEQRKKMTHPILRERSRARCGSSSAVRRSLLPSLQMI